MQYSQTRRTERRIATARLVLASVSLLAVRLNPGQAGHHGDVVNVLVAGYALYAAVFMLLVWRASRYLNRLRIAAHIIDIAVFSVFIYFTQGTTSLFYVYFVFALIAGGLRWQWRGTLVTAAGTLVAFLGAAILAALRASDPDFDQAGLFIAIAYLGVVAGLLAMLGVHEARHHREVGRLAVWSQDASLDAAQLAPHARWLARAAETMGVRRALFAWEDEEEPWLRIALWEDGHTAISRAAPADFSPLVAADLEDEAFVCADARGGPAALTLFGTEGKLHRRTGPAVNEELADRFAMGAVISTPVNAGEGKARLFFLDKRHVDSEDLALARIVSAGVALRVTASHLQASEHKTAALEERVCVARDLHDGVLQSLAGTALQLETARRLLAIDPSAARDIIESVQETLTQEQRDLRHFVDAIRPGYAVGSAVVPDLRERLREVSENVSRQWGLTVEALVENDPDEDLGALNNSEDALARDIAFIVHEGLVNGARHAQATRAWATVRGASECVEIVVGDDGHGFGFQGRLDSSALRDLGTGPRTLMQRVESLGGTLIVESGAGGSRIEITLPLAADVASLAEFS